jgi:hypothetical protein
VEPLVKETDSQEVSNGKHEEYLSEGGGYETTEFMPPPGPNVHPFVGKQGESYVHESTLERNGEIMRNIVHNINS